MKWCVLLAALVLGTVSEETPSLMVASGLLQEDVAAPSAGRGATVILKSQETGGATIRCRLFSRTPAGVPGQDVLGAWHDSVNLRRGTRVRLCFASGSRSRFNVATVEVCGSDSASEMCRLWYFRRYFDLIDDPPEERMLASAVARAVGAKNRGGESTCSLWLRTRLQESLAFYRSSTVESVIERWGFPQLEADTAAVRRLLDAHGEEVTLIEALPFMPRGPTDLLLGGWGVFPLRVYSAGEQTRPQLLFESAFRR